MGDRRMVNKDKIGRPSQPSTSSAFPALAGFQPNVVIFFRELFPRLTTGLTQKDIGQTAHISNVAQFRNLARPDEA